MRRPGPAPLPCKSCPWRVANDASVIPRYDRHKAFALTETVGDLDGFRPIMACHRSTPEQAIPCKGYLARAGRSNLFVRLMVVRGAIKDPMAVRQAVAAAGIELHATYADVLAKLEPRP